MELLKIALKIFSITFFMKFVEALIGLFGSISSIETFGINVYLISSLYVVLYFVVFLIIFVQPKWFTKVLGKNIGSLKIENISSSSLIDIGVILISISYICTGFIRIISFILQYAIKFNMANSQYNSNEKILNDALLQMESLIGLIVGVILLIFRRKVIESIIKKEKNE